MAEGERQYRVISGIVQFDPREAEAAGKKVRYVTVRQTGLREQAVLVSLTVWPSHADVPLAQGDVIFAEGVFTRKTTNDDQGNARTYNNLGVSRLLVLGNASQGVREDRQAVAEEPEEEPEEDDIPY